MDNRYTDRIKATRDRLGEGPLILIQRVWLWLGWLAFGVFAVRFILYYLPPLQTVALFLTTLAFCLPGWVLLSLLWGGEHATRRPELWLWGGVLGMLLNAWLSAIEGYLTGSANGYAVLVLDAVAMIAWFSLTRRTGFDRVRIRRWTFGERALWQVVSLWILVLFYRVYLPFEHVAGSGFTIYPLAVAPDLFAYVTEVSSLSLGLPPHALALSHVAGPMSSGMALFPVIGRGWMDPAGAMLGWVIVTNFLISLAFVGVMLTTVRMFVAPLRLVVVTIFMLVFAGSLYWLYPVIRPDLIAMAAARGDGAGLITRMIGPLFPRWILTQPQTAMTLTLGFVAVGWFRIRPLPPSWPHLAALGLLGGLVTGMDYTVGWLGIVFAGLWALTLWFDYPNDRLRLGIGLLLCGAGALVTLVPIIVLGVQSPQALFGLTLALPESGVITAVARLTITFGFLLILGIWGMVRTGGDAVDARFVCSILAVVLAVGLILFARTPSDPQYGVRAGVPVLFILVTVGTSRLLSGQFPFSGRHYWIFLGALLLAVPTTVTDYYFAGFLSDTDHQMMIHPDDKQAAEWARTYLPQEAIVQSAPDYVAGTDSLATEATPLSWAASLAQRPMIAGATGLVPPLMRDTLAYYRERVHKMYRSTHPDSLHAQAVRLGVEYLYAGPTERQRHPRLRMRLLTSRDLFEVVYETDSAVIVEVYPIAPSDR